MSSISALWTRGRSNLAEPLHERMQAAQAMYGPESNFGWSDGQLSLGGSLMRLLPEDVHDRQPLWSSDRTACLVADVRLDNRSDLVRELGLVRAAELADSEILLAAWLRWGAACLDHIVGGFAFAVWNPVSRELFAARDHAGERPLFFARGEDFFALASMPKGLLALPQVPGGVRESQVADWLVGIYPKGRQSFFEGVEMLPMGHFLRVTPERFECTRYWNPASGKPVRFKRDEEYAEALREILDRATESRLRSPRGIGSHLSAGLDSSSVTASAALLLEQRGQRLTAFTAVPRPDFNGRAMPWQIVAEDAGAAEVARCFPNVDHVLVSSAGYGLAEEVQRWTDAVDEPVVHATNMLWFSAIQDQARERGLGVLLTGQTGNVTISWETWAILNDFFRQGRWGKLLQTVKSTRKDGTSSYKASIAAATGGVLPAWLLRRLGLRPAFGVGEEVILNPDLLREDDRMERMLALQNHVARDPVEEQTALLDGFDFGTINAGIRALAHVDPRDPTADKRVFDFCFGIPQEQYIVGGHWRSLVRRAMRGRLPESTVSRYKRGRQGADWYLPLAEALPDLRSEFARLETLPAGRRLLDLPKLGGLVETWPDKDYETSRVDALWHTGLTRGFTVGHFLLSHAATAVGTSEVEASDPMLPAASGGEGSGSVGD